MSYDEVLHFKVSKEHINKLQEVKRLTGLTQGAVIRRAIEALRVVPAQFEVIVEVDQLQSEDEI